MPSPSRRGRRTPRLHRQRRPHADGGPALQPAQGPVHKCRPGWGGSATVYAYPTDPTNQTDLDGRRWQQRRPSGPCMASASRWYRGQTGLGEIQGCYRFHFCPHYRDPNRFRSRFYEQMMWFRTRKVGAVGLVLGLVKKTMWVGATISAIGLWPPARYNTRSSQCWRS